MRWADLSIQTIREDNHPWLVRAGYRRGAEWLPLGQRSIDKIARILTGEPDLRRALDRCGIAYIEAGGDLAVESSAGDAVLVRGANYAALHDRAVSIAQPPAVPDPQGDLAPEEFATPGVKTIAQIAAFSGLPATSQMKSLVMLADGKPVLILLRGDHQMSEWKFKQATRASQIRQATAEELRAWFGADAGSLGPVGVKSVRILADEALRGRRNMISGANRTDFHLCNVTPGEDFEADFADLRLAAEGDACSADRGPLTFTSAIVLTQPGDPSQILELAALQHCDADGLALPAAIAPSAVVVTPVHPDRLPSAEQIHASLISAGIDALLDDRDARPGVKFKDADLIGFPYRITVGKKLAEGLVELVTRSPKQTVDVPVSEIAARIPR